MRTLALIALFLLPITVKADEPRFSQVFVSQNGKYELRYQSGQLSQQNWAFTEKATGAVRYQIVGEFASRTVLVCDDGVNLVVVDDFSARRPIRELDVLLFYRDGSLLKKYSLAELLRDVSNIESSVSHFQWFFKPSALSVIDSRLKLETFELIDYEFDVRTGDLLKKETNPILSEDSVYVYGKVKKLGGRRFEIDVCQQVHGTVPQNGKIEFVADRDDSIHFDNFYYSVIVKYGKLIATQGVILNSCNYRKGNSP